MNCRFHNKLIRIFVAALLIGMCRAETVGTGNEDMGITVSQTPAAGWNQNTARPASKKILWFILLTVGSVMTLSSTVFLKIKKRTVKESVPTTPRPVPQQTKEIPPEPVIQPMKPVSESSRLQPGYEQPAQRLPVMPAEKKQELPAVRNAVSTATEKPVEPGLLEDNDDDVLLKHLDLLRHLKNEAENKEHK